MLQVGSVLDGKYKILNEIGHGGMSTVYLALNERANKTWAVKEVRKTGGTSYEVVRQGLLAETNILKRLNHPNLPSIIDVIDADDSFVIVMDFIEGTDLQKRLRSGPQPWQYVVDWGIQLCDVLDYLHSQNPPIIYRDMKPANVMLKPEGEFGRAMLLDFGTAREYKGVGASSDTSCLGTKGYAAPEQYGGQGETDPRTDIYTLGATLYHLVTGHRPDEPPYNRMLPIRQWNPKLPEGLEAIILKCCESNKADRYQSCKELKYALQHVEEQSATHIRGQKRKMRLFMTTAIMTLAFAVLGAGSILGYSLQRSAQYDSKYDEAVRRVATSPAEGSEDYNNAQTALLDCIELNSRSIDAYDELVDLYFSDNLISLAENSKMSQYYTNLSRNAEYEEFCLKFGEYVFLCYGENGQVNLDSGRLLAGEYLKAAMGDEDDDDKTESEKLAGYFYTISSSNLSQQSTDSNRADALRSQNGESVYNEYWNALEEIDCANLQADINDVYLTLSFYQVVLSDINAHYADFINHDISKQAILDKIAEIETGLQNVDNTGLVTSSMSSLRESLDDYVERAENAVNAAGQG